MYGLSIHVSHLKKNFGNDLDYLMIRETYRKNDLSDLLTSGEVIDAAAKNGSVDGKKGDSRRRRFCSMPHSSTLSFPKAFSDCATWFQRSARVVSLFSLPTLLIPTLSLCAEGRSVHRCFHFRDPPLSYRPARVLLLLHNFCLLFTALLQFRRYSEGTFLFLKVLHFAVGSLFCVPIFGAVFDFTEQYWKQALHL